EAGDVLQENERNLALAAQLDKVRALEGGFGKQNAVVGDDAHRHSLQMSEAADQGGAVAGLEFVELGAVHQAGNDFAHIKGSAQVRGKQPVEVLGGVERFARFAHIQLHVLFAIQVAHAG